MSVPNRKALPSPLPRWHKPKIIDLGIHVSPKKNTWRNFLNIIDKQFTSHQSFPIVYPEVRIVSKHTVDGKLRSRDARRRIKENPRRDPVRCHHLYLHDSAVTAILDDVEIEQSQHLNEQQTQNNQQAELTDQERDRRIDLILASVLEFVAKDNTGVVRRAVKNQRNALRRR